MAVWNNMVRGHVIAIKTHMGWDPTKIVDEFNPMPTQHDMDKPGNPNGMGNLASTPDSFPNDQTEQGKPGMDAIEKLGRSSGSKYDPDAGKGEY